MVGFAFDPKESENTVTITLHAQPYDTMAKGFYFNTAEDFDDKAAKLANSFDDPVEEFEIQFIDGEQIDCELAKAIDLNQVNFRDYLTCVEAWEDPTKLLTPVEVSLVRNPRLPTRTHDVQVIMQAHVDLAQKLQSIFIRIPFPSYPPSLPRHQNSGTVLGAKTCRFGGNRTLIKPCKSNINFRSEEKPAYGTPLASKCF